MRHDVHAPVLQSFGHEHHDISATAAGDRGPMACLGALAIPVGRRGAIAAIVAVSSIVLIGFAGLAVEGGTWLLALSKATTAADLAALAGATAREGGLSATAVATDTATRNGFVQGGAVTVTVNNPPASGAYLNNAAAVEVIVTQVQNVALARMFLSTAPTVRSRAVAAANHGCGRVCVDAWRYLQLER